MGIPGLRQYRLVSRTSRIRFDEEDAHVPIQRPFRHNVTAKGRTKCSSSRIHMHRSFLWVLSLCWAMRSSYMDIPKRELPGLTTKLSVALPQVSRLKIADSKGVRSCTTSLPENSYVKALARLGIFQFTHLGVLH